ncbi:MAG: helix-turn-helix domain-containing protein [Rhodoblastus sp.]|nr:MAG: helix-turn-helix domain-containing protein [Rhodoblastus sp.]
MRKAGSSLAGVGRDVGLSRKTMSWALIKPHPRANKAIAARLGRPLHELWPDWFDAAGAIRVSKGARSETAPSPSHKSKREAA